VVKVHGRGSSEVAGTHGTGGPAPDARQDARRGWLGGLKKLPFFVPAGRLDVSTHSDLDQAWNTLRLVVEWIRHAEAKAGAALAASGLLGGLLYQLVISRRNPGAVFFVFVLLCATAVVAAGFCAGLALRPQLTIRTGMTSLLYYHHIARHHPRRSGLDTYLESMRRLSRSPELLLTEVVAQIWANAHVASAKYRWSGLAIVATLLAMLALGAAAVAAVVTP
jgi:hypothetical protein